MSNSTQNNSYKFMTYTAYVNDILYDYRIPCYHYVCPQCRKYYIKPNCDKCNIDCEEEPYKYAFFNNQIYQQRISANNGKIYYATVVGQFKCRPTINNNAENSISYRKIIKQLFEKCIFYFDNENIIIIDDKSKEPEIKEEKHDISENVQSVKSNAKALVLKSKEESEYDKLYDEFDKKLKSYDVKRNPILVDRFIDKEPDYKDYRNYRQLCEGSIYKQLCDIDELLTKCELFRFGNEEYEQYLEYIEKKYKTKEDNHRKESAKAFIEFYYMIIHSYVIACSNLPKVRELIKEYQKINENVVKKFFDSKEIENIMSKLNYEDAARKFDEECHRDKVPLTRIIDRLYYSKSFTYKVLKIDNDEK